MNFSVAGLGVASVWMNMVPPAHRRFKAGANGECLVSVADGDGRRTVKGRHFDISGQKPVSPTGTGKHNQKSAMRRFYCFNELIVAPSIAPGRSRLPSCT